MPQQPSTENASDESRAPGKDGAASAAEPSQMGWRRQLLIAGVVLAVGLVAFGPGRPLISNAFTSSDGTEAQSRRGGPGARGGAPGGRPAPSVVLATATEARDGLTLRLTGGAVAKRSAELKPRAAGRVTEVLFTAGDALKAGQSALTLENRREQLALERADVTLREAMRRLDRARRLTSSGSGSEAALDAAETEAEIARIARDEAREALADRTVLAPFDGVASLPLVEIGDRIEPATVIANIDDRSSLLVEVGAPEAAFDRLDIGAPVRAETAAFAGERFEGRVAELDSRVDPETRTVTLRAEIPNAADRLRPGMSFTLSFELPGRPVIAVPELALQWERKGAFVWRVRDGKAERTPVRLAARQDGAALLQTLEDDAKALRPGDQVVVEGVQRLRDGGRVSVVSDDVGGGETSGAPRPDARKDNSDSESHLPFQGADGAVRMAERRP